MDKFNYLLEENYYYYNKADIGGAIYINNFPLPYTESIYVSYTDSRNQYGWVVNYYSEDLTIDKF